ncbi:MAG: DeoR/GlpR transcriptional regulator [Clostridia bacterium]|nr:DeoR/GlpR transcriptional regulator [Clostridia bacterium]
MLSTEKRREDILAEIHSKGKVRVSELSKRYGISEVSIRKDLEHLEMQGQLSRVHGGAVGIGRLYVSMDLTERFKTNSGSKKRLAKAIAALIEDNDTIIMNSGTTLSYVLHALEGKKNITIVTNSVQNAAEASLISSFAVILLGGEFESKYQFTYGEDALLQLENYHATKCILSVDGISADSGLTLFYSTEAALARKMTECSGEVIVAADSSKVGRHAFAKITDIRHSDTLVTNVDADREEILKIEKLGVRVIRA